MNRARIWMKWMSALTITVAAAACGTTISEPIRAGQSNSTASPVTPTLLVKDLSPQDAEAWCAWYVDTFSPGEPAPVSAEVVDGYTCRGAFGFMICGDQPSPLCVVRPSIEQCVQNLQRKPCEA